MSALPYLTFIAALSCFIGGLGCDGVGRRLVDHAPKNEDLPPDVCVAPPECDVPFDLPELAPKEARKVVVPGCDQALPDAVAETVRCSPLRWPEDDLGTIRQAGFTLRHKNWVIESEAPLDVYLEGAIIDDVWLALRGPVSLHLSGRSMMTDLRIEMTPRSEDGPAPIITMDDSDATDLVFATTAQAGDLTVKRSRLKRAQLAGDTVMLESVVSTELIVEATRVTVVDLFAQDAQFGFDEAVLSSSMLSRVRVTRCGSATMAGTIVDQLVMAACTRDAFHAYHTSIGGGSFDGAIDSDASSFSNVLFGANSKTELHAWVTTFSNVNFCRRTTATFGESTSISCSRCDKGRREVFACTLPGEILALAENACPVLDETPVCSSPYPARPRPHEAL